MATSIDFINYVCEQLEGLGEIHYKKMFGEYMVYLNNKPVVIVCGNVAFVKKLDEIQTLMKQSEIGYPYKGAKEHYVLDLDQRELCRSVITEIEKVTKVPQKKK